MLALCLCLVTAVHSQALLKNVPITFALEGNTSYIPTTGGVAVQGYTIKIGFNYYSWLGVMFMTLTSTSNYDTLILQRSATQSSGVYTTTVSDYYVSSGRQGTLMSDTLTSFDLTTSSSSTSSEFVLTYPRTKSNTNGQDWQGGQIVSICFFTSDSRFSQASWSRTYQQCYGYEINDYTSTFRGSYLGIMPFEGVNSNVYGGIYGPFLNMQLFWYRNSLTMTNATSIIIRIGEEISPELGYDYHKCGSGDYYGPSPSTMREDLVYSGYNNGQCTYSTTSQSVKMSFSRDLYTYDSFDSLFGQSISICLIGSQSHCSSFSLPLIMPSLAVSSALTISQPYLLPLPTLTLLLLLTLVVLL